IRTVYTSRRFLTQLASRGVELDALFTSANVGYLEDLSTKISAAEKLLRLLAVKLLPAPVLRLFFCRARSNDATAAILFSSGSEGLPKGVCLSHKTIMANVKQIADVLNAEGDD